MEGDVFQGVEPLARARLSDADIVLPEEQRVSQSGGQHALVARKDRGAVVWRLDIGDSDELFDPAGLGVFQREKLLVFLHRGLQHLWRQAEELVLNVAHQDDRPFDQPRDLRQQAFVLDHFHTLREGHVGGVGPDAIAAVGGVQHHLGGGEFRCEIVEICRRDRVRRHEAVAVGLGA